jgi:transcriptional regulator with XRE-family HTH domain
MHTAIKPEERIAKLINAAAQLYPSENQLAQAIGYTRSELSQWKLGKRACPVEAQVLLAAVAGLDAEEVLAYALIERNADTARGEKLLTALGKGSGFMSAAKAGLLGIFASVALAFSVPTPSYATSHDVYYVKSKPDAGQRLV